MGSSHPLVWAHEFDGGRAWYTAMGHTSASYTDPLFRQHLWGGILWAAGQESVTYLPLLNSTLEHMKSPTLEAMKR
jgi:type 1 glutamine amidotransferase